MALRKLAVASVLGYGFYRLFGRRKSGERAAFAPGEANITGFSQVRNAGPAAMASDNAHWDRVDEASDESFPASDAPGSY